MITVTKGQWFPLTIGNISYAGAAFDLQGATEVNAALVSTLGVKSPLSFEITAYNEISAVCDGSLSAGKYAIEVSCKGADGKSYRMKSPGAVIEVSSSTTPSTGTTSVRVAGDEWELTADVEIHEGQARTYMSLLEEARKKAVKATEEATEAANRANSTVDEVTKAVDEVTKAVEDAGKASEDAKKAVSDADKAKTLSEEQTAKAEKTNSDITAAESARVTAENGRVNEESERVTAETARTKSESARTEAEMERETNEQTRQANETTRQAAEEKRESDTATAIATMKSDTSSAVKTMQDTTAAAMTSMDEHRSAFDDAEVKRVNNEQARQEAESERETQERARMKNEDGRVKSEEARVNSEGARVQAEAARATAENEREQGYTEKTAHLEELLQYIKDNHLESDAKLAEAIKNTITGTDEFVYLDANDGNVKSMPNTNRIGANVAAVYYAGKRSIGAGEDYKITEENEIIQNLDLSGWDFEAATDMTRFFNYLYALRTLTLPDNMTLANVTDMNLCFYNDNFIRFIDTSKWTLENVTNMKACFQQCNSLQTLDTSKWTLANVTDMDGCFYECRSLQTLDTSKWTLANVTDMNLCFYNCLGFLELDLSSCNITKCINWNNWIYACKNLETLRIGLIDFSLCGAVDFLCDTNIRELTGTLKGIKNNFTATSNRMTRDSCMVVINGLETVTEARTLTLGANNKPVSLGGKGNDPISDDDLKVATDKGWTVQFA